MDGKTGAKVGTNGFVVHKCESPKNVEFLGPSGSEIEYQAELKFRDRYLDYANSA
jgi:hypothetical protein